jgi:thiol:disulfide interchange protein
MLFNSFGFIFLYLPVVLIGFLLLGRISHSLAAAWLALASLFFYGYWHLARKGGRTSQTDSNAGGECQYVAAGLLQIRELLRR